MVGSTGCRLFNMLKDDILTDVTFLVQGTEVKGHRVVAASRGGKLRDLAYSKAERIEISDEISLRTFKSLLEYLYTDLIEIDDSNIFELMHAANVFGLPHLEQQCAKEIQSRLADSNVGNFATQALQLNATETLKVCQDYFTTRTSQFLKTQQFLEISIDVLEKFCSTDKIDCTEGRLFDACLDWARYTCQQRGMDETPENLRAVLGHVLSKIRFSSMPMEHFHKFVIPMNILPFEEVGRIMMGWETMEKRVQCKEEQLADECDKNTVEDIEPHKPVESDYLKFTEKYFKTQTAAFIKSVEFLEVSNETLVALCCCDIIRCSEIELFKTCVEWAKCECKRRNLPITARDQRMILGDVLDKIRFPAIPLQIFTRDVIPMEILTFEEIGAIIFQMQTGKRVSKYYNQCREVNVKVIINGYYYYFEKNFLPKYLQIHYSKTIKQYAETDMLFPISTTIAEMKEMKIFHGGEISVPADEFLLKVVKPYQRQVADYETLESMSVPGQDLVLEMFARKDYSV